MAGSTVVGVKGTPAYIAPEIWEDSLYTPASDIYAFGVLANEVLTGVVPFADVGYAQILFKTVNNIRPASIDVDAADGDAVLIELAGCIDLCWQRDASTRPTAAGVLGTFTRLLYAAGGDPRNAVPITDTDPSQDTAVPVKSGETVLIPFSSAAGSAVIQESFSSLKPIPATTSGAAHPTSVFAIEPTKIAGSAGTKPLASLTIKEVETLFDALNLGAYKSLALDGEVLSYCTTIEDVISLGITVRPRAAVLLAKVSEFRADGVPSTLLTPSVFVSKAVPTPVTKAPTPTGPPNAEALLQAAKDGKVDDIRTCLNNHTDIESKDEVFTTLQ
jgi:serine/threonine protein kinase